MPSTEEVVEATVTPSPTQGPTATVWPPVFDPRAIVDNSVLDSFILTINVKNTFDGDLTDVTTTIGYIKEPFSTYNLMEFPSSPGEARTYVIGGWSYYMGDIRGDWYLTKQPYESLPFAANILSSGNMAWVLSALFVGQEEYEGVPAFHFTFDETNLDGYETNTEANPSPEVEGDFYLTQEGKYVLYSHSKSTNISGDFVSIYEVTEALSSINQLTEITLPADFLEMDPALELPQEQGLPLPTDTTLAGLIRYNSGGSGVDYYTYTTSVNSNDEFLDFYRNLPPTDGWTVSHIGKVSLHAEFFCEFFQDCVIIYKGDAQVILYYNGGTITAEFDWKHRFSPLEN